MSTFHISQMTIKTIEISLHLVLTNIINGMKYNVITSINLLVCNYPLIVLLQFYCCFYDTFNSTAVKFWSMFLCAASQLQLWLWLSLPNEGWGFAGQNWGWALAQGHQLPTGVNAGAAVASAVRDALEVKTFTLSFYLCCIIWCLKKIYHDQNQKWKMERH